MVTGDLRELLARRAVLVHVALRDECVGADQASAPNDASN
jgi:hypothetical protein